MLDKKNILSNIPSVDELIKNEEIQKLIDICPRIVLVQVIRDYLSECRQIILSSKTENFDINLFGINKIVQDIKQRTYKKMENNLKHVVNSTGVVIHTNLGRAPLSPYVINQVIKISSGYSNLEMDIETGTRGSRYDHVEELLKELTNAEAAMVVNNNAAAVMLVLNTMAKNKEVIVSRGQLVEIGGSFRIPDVMAESGANLVEVGTTNKTHIWDYERAISEETAALMKVHTSNYRILGFMEEVSSEELTELGRKNNIPIIEDLGSGVLIDLTKYSLPYEPTVQNSIASGMDVVTFSGDKMLGGPQAGIIIGRKEYIEKMKKNPLTRAFRIDKMTLAALEGTLKLYLDEDKAIKNVPVLRMLTEELEELSIRAELLYKKLDESLGDVCSINIEDGYSEVGGGAMPLHKLSTKLVTLYSDDISVNELEKRLRNFETPIIARIFKDKVIIDVRTVQEEDFQIIKNALIHALT